MSQRIRNFEILGERCSGTNFLEETMLHNFEIEFKTFSGHKHFFCFNNYDDKNVTDNTLYIGIIRNPIYWLNSFSKELHHVPEKNRKNLFAFLFNRFYSVHDEGQKPAQQFINGNGSFYKAKIYKNEYNINKDDLNYLNGKTYKNIFEMRNVKNHFLINVMPTKVKNYILINYEDLLFNFEMTLNTIKNKFNLIPRLPSFVKVKKYKKCETYNFVKQREITFPPQIINIIWNNLNVPQENFLGYYQYDNNSFFLKKTQT